MGFSQPIPPGGLFPLHSSPAEAASLEGLLWKSGNHPSFSVEHEGEAKPPGLNILKGYYDKGYAARYTEERSAIEQHGELLYAPLGTLTKLKAGKLKHRILQDLRQVS